MGSRKCCVFPHSVSFSFLIAPNVGMSYFISNGLMDILSWIIGQDPQFRMNVLSFSKQWLTPVPRLFWKLFGIFSQNDPLPPVWKKNLPNLSVLPSLI